MITDEQVNVACNRINERHSYTVASKKAMREVLETFEQSKWVKFDEYDEATYPPFDVRVLTKLKGDFGVDMGIDSMSNSLEWYNAIRLSNVTHWQYLPEFKE